MAHSSTAQHVRRLGAVWRALDLHFPTAARLNSVAMDSAKNVVMNEQVIVDKLPEDTLSVDCFRLQKLPAPTAESLDEGEILCETIAFVIAAGQRAGLQGSASYAGAPVTGVTMGGSSVSRVIASNDPGVPVGAMVSSNGWERFTVQKGEMVTQYEEGTDGLDPVHHIGVLGGNGLTAYFGLLDVGKPQPGETVVVSGAAGSVGHLVCQLAKNAGCRVVGIAGECTLRLIVPLLTPGLDSPPSMWFMPTIYTCLLFYHAHCHPDLRSFTGSDDKCDILRSDLGVDETVNYKSPDFRKEIAAACPNKIDVYFDNTGGTILQTALFNMATHGRIVCCGNVSQYDTSTPEPGPRGVPGLLVNNRVTMQGFLVSDWSSADAATAKAELRKMVVQGALKPWVNEFHGLEKGPEAFVDMLSGGNLGTTTVRLQ